MRLRTREVSSDAGVPTGGVPAGGLGCARPPLPPPAPGEEPSRAGEAAAAAASRGRDQPSHMNTSPSSVTAAVRYLPAVHARGARLRCLDPLSLLADLSTWREDFPSKPQALKEAPFPAPWTRRFGLVRHGFTHFELEIEVYFVEVTSHPPLEEGSNARQRVRGGAEGEARWVARENLANVALPTVMRKIVAHGLDEGGPLFTAQ